MLKVYFLPVERDETTNTEKVKGSQYISQAISETTEKPDVRRVIIEENSNLAILALKVEEPTEGDIANYNDLPAPPKPEVIDWQAEWASKKGNVAAQLEQIGKFLGWE